jgi:alkylation response protein AidB-like acyl-CoA dehydrogenase
MTDAINRYKADLRDFQFVLFEQFKLDEILSKPPFDAWGRDEAMLSMREAYRFVCDVLGPTNRVGDVEGCRLVDGQVYTPSGYKAAWQALYESGWRAIGQPPEFGGQGAPYALGVVIEEMLAGANATIASYSGLTLGAAELITEFGTPAQVERYVGKMVAGQWSGTMCLTEPHAGTDVGMAKSSARKNADGTYAIRGTKIFISGGDQDMVENIVHLVLARIEGAAPGTKGLSLFLVPKYRIRPDGSVGAPNDVAVAGIEHKMGYHGSATCQLNFGENDGCVGELIGTVEHRGMAQMFKMMNFARIGTGVHGLALASAAYLSALEYARDRKQGPSIAAWKDPTSPRVPIIEHPDVRRMLLDMKARVEGIRALAVKLAAHTDRARALAGSDDEARSYHSGQVDLLTPIMKAYGSDQGFAVCTTAIQTFGGAGYLKDHPVEQYCRDSKIFSIYEGTNHIQAMDLVGRKMPQNGGASMQTFLGEIATFVEANRQHPVLGAAVEQLGRAHEALAGSTMRLLGWFQSGEIGMVPLVANRFLEMMAETVVGWLLLDAARIAVDRAATLPEGSAERAFYDGKRAAGVYFAHNVLPGVGAKAEMIGRGDDSALAIAAESFATV